MFTHYAKGFACERVYGLKLLTLSANSLPKSVLISYAHNSFHLGVNNVNNVFIYNELKQKRFAKVYCAVGMFTQNWIYFLLTFGKPE